MSPLRGIACAAFVLAAGATAALTAAAQTTPTTHSLTIKSLAGRDIFEFYCATCHGSDGKGHGPVAAALKDPVPDLTRLARGRGGVFPRQRVESYVTNGGGVLLSAAHGTSDMPVWGPLFRGLDPSNTLVRIRIANVVGYIESIQEKE